MKIECLNCGNEFTRNRPWQKYCSQDCQLIHYNKTHDIPGQLRAKRAKTHIARMEAEQNTNIEQIADIMSERSSQ